MSPRTTQRTRAGTMRLCAALALSLVIVVATSSANANVNAQQNEAPRTTIFDRVFAKHPEHFDRLCTRVHLRLAKRFAVVDGERDEHEDTADTSAMSMPSLSVPALERFTNAANSSSSSSSSSPSPSPSSSSPSPSTIPWRDFDSNADEKLTRDELCVALRNAMTSTSSMSATTRALAVASWADTRARMERIVCRWRSAFKQWLNTQAQKVDLGDGFLGESWAEAVRAMDALECGTSFNSTTTTQNATMHVLPTIRSDHLPVKEASASATAVAAAPVSASTTPVALSRRGIGEKQGMIAFGWTVMLLALLSFVAAVVIMPLGLVFGVLGALFMALGVAQLSLAYSYVPVVGESGNEAVNATVPMSDVNVNRTIADA